MAHRSLMDVLWGPRGSRRDEEEDARGRSRSPLGGRRSREVRRATVSVPGKRGTGAGKSVGASMTGEGRRRTVADGNGKYLALRSRSSSVHRNASSATAGPNKETTDDEETGDEEEGHGESGGDEKEVQDPIEAHAELLHAMPPDIVRRCLKLGPVNDVWVNSHPLSMSPVAFQDALAAIQGMTNLSERKRSEWEQDTIRDTDEVRMNRLEEFLVFSRDSSTELQFSGSIRKLREHTHGISRKREDDRTGKYTYYRDKGRQATKSCGTNAWKG